MTLCYSLFQVLPCLLSPKQAVSHKGCRSHRLFQNVPHPGRWVGHCCVSRAGRVLCAASLMLPICGRAVLSRTIIAGLSYVQKSLRHALQCQCRHHLRFSARRAPLFCRFNLCVCLANKSDEKFHTWFKPLGRRNLPLVLSWEVLWAEGSQEQPLLTPRERVLLCPQQKAHSPHTPALCCPWGALLQPQLSSAGRWL